MHYLPGARRVAGFLLISLLTGCSGSGGGDAAGVEISTNAIRFSAAGADAPTPASEVITVTFGSDIAHLAVIHSGDAIVGATSVMNGRTAQITVEPAAPANVGPGAFVGAVAVTGYTCADATCTRLSAGSTSTVSVRYQISPLVQLVTPYVATAGVSNSVVIRGRGLQSFAVEGALFGDTPATNVAVLSATEIRATYPALPAGTYTVGLNIPTHEGAIPSTATLVVVDPIAYAPAILPYPAGTSTTRRLLYDAERSSLLAVTDGAGGSIVRYTYDGGAWGAPIDVAANLRDAALSTNGTQLFALAATAVVPVDPVTLALGTAIDATPPATDPPTEPPPLKNIVVGNDNRAVITTASSSNTATLGYIFTPSASAVQQHGVALNNATLGISTDGAAAVLVQGDPSLTTAPLTYIYTASANAFSASVVALNQNVIAPVLDRAANRVVLNGTRVYDSTFRLLGTLPNTTTAVALKPDGTRAYAYDPEAGGILIYDTSVADRDGAPYEPLGAAVPLFADPGGVPQMIISADGGTLFLAGPGAGIVVQPTPSG